MSTAIIILLSFILLIWFISRWLHLAASPDRHFLHPHDDESSPAPDTQPENDTPISVAKPANSDSDAHLSS